MTKSLARFASWLLDAFTYLAITIINFGVDVINAAILLIASIFGSLINILPDAEVNIDPPAELLAFAGHLNWFIPMHAVAGSIGLICVSYIAFFTIRPVAKFLQLA